MAFIGIDIGTTSICCVVFDTQSLAVLHSRSLANDACIGQPFAHEKAHMQDAERLLDLVIQLLDGAFVAGDIQGIGIASQMHGILYVDSAGEALTPLFTWLDRRTESLFEGQGLSYLRYMHEHITGSPTVAAGYGLATHFFLQQNKQLPTATGAVKLCSIGDFVAMRLVGRSQPVAEPTLCHSLGLFDVSGKVFCPTALRALGIDPEFLPELSPSDTVLGEYRSVPVAIAIGDNQAAFCGSVRDPENMALLTLGTSGQVSCYSRSGDGGPNIEVRPYLDGAYLFVGASLCGGKSYQILAEFFQAVGAWLFPTPGGGQVSRDSIYERMNAVDISRLADMPSLQPFFAGSRQSPQAGGVLSNISERNLRPEHLFAGFVFGVVEELYGLFAGFPAKARPPLLAACGNFIARCPHAEKAIRQVFKRPLYLLRHPEPTALGAALHVAALCGAEQWEGVRGAEAGAHWYREALD
ncbi:MAG: FGGY family carbohydrate kinase [Spirochaetota bacterium]